MNRKTFLKLIGLSALAAPFVAVGAVKAIKAAPKAEAVSSVQWAYKYTGELDTTVFQITKGLHATIYTCSSGVVSGDPIQLASHFDIIDLGDGRIAFQQMG